MNMPNPTIKILQICSILSLTSKLPEHASKHRARPSKLVHGRAQSTPEPQPTGQAINPLPSNTKHVFCCSATRFVNPKVVGPLDDSR